jgi:hypothetical protein
MGSHTRSDDIGDAAVSAVHDMGGARGYGRVIVEVGEPVYHARWEGRVHGMMRRLLTLGVFNLDQFRDAVERIPAMSYLESTYYERWLSALETLVRGSDAISLPPPEHNVETAFIAGDRVTTRNMNPQGHTRLPRYARGKRGVIESVHGPFRLPDTRAHLVGIDWEPVYTVVLEARELWGPEAEPSASVRIDLWQSYLERRKA